MFIIENDQLKVAIQAKGAELNSIVRKANNLEYMWGADPQYWAKKSPVLFPVVGALKEETFWHNGNSYHLPRHGFAREMHFAVTNQSTESVTFSLSNDAETMAKFPFPFQFNITYTLTGDTLAVTYTVQNKANEVMYFSVGGHPAFKVPLVEGTAYTDYELCFNKKETTGRWPVTKEGLIGKEPSPLLNNTDVLPLSKTLFDTDAVVLKGLQSTSVRLQSSQTPHGLNFDFSGFPYLGLWAAPGADFLCIEPWCGIADSVDADGQLSNKEGINALPAGAVFERTWRVQFF